MLIAFTLTVFVGIAVAAVTAVDPRLQIAEELGLAALVSVSGAVAGWAIVGTVGGVGNEEPNAWDLVGAATGAVLLSGLAWRSRRVLMELDRALPSDPDFSPVAGEIPGSDADGLAEAQRRAAVYETV